MKIKAKGQLRHRFWGEYSALIGLRFDNEDHALLGLHSQKLGDGWERAKDPQGIVWVGDSKALEACKVMLGKLGADTKKIDSTKYSIDYGEPFEIELDVEDPNQIRMF